METIHCLGYSIFTKIVLPEYISDKQTIINTINPHCFCEAKKDQLYNQALQESDILLPDGIGIVWAVKVLSKLRIKRFTGSDLHSSLLQKMNNTGGKVFYLGSSDSTLKMIHDRIRVEYPAICVASFSPPFKSEFTKAENDLMLDSVNEFKPDVLFVGMTAPKQEKWVHQHKDQIHAKVIASIGAVFDFYGGRVKRSGKFWIYFGLEWLPRLLREPKRLWKRNLYSTPRFIWYVCMEKIRISFHW